jgi:predicted transcriptional regulator
MKTPKIPKPTEGELEILQVIWKNGPSTVREVHDILSLQKEAGYTTTLKLMQILHEKGMVRRKKSGRTHIYESLIRENDIQLQMLDRLLDTAFHGSAMELVLQALGNRTSSEEEIQQIRNFLDQLEGEES